MTTNGFDPQQSIKSWQRLKRLARFLFVYGFIPYFSILVLFTVIQRKLMYQPTISQDLSVASAKLDAKTASDVHIQTRDAVTLKGWLIHRPRDERDPQDAPLVIYFPGNSGNRHERLSDLLEIGKSGFDVLIFDYRGYGDSTGTPSESALTADAQLIWQFACTELKYPPTRIVVFGESLGGAVALSIWSTVSEPKPHPAAVILNSTFATMPEVVAWHYPFFPFQFLIFDRWRSIDRISRVQSPVVLFHGTADDIVPLSQGKLLATHSGNARLIEIPGGNHNSIPMGLFLTELKEIQNRIAQSSDAGHEED